MNKNSAIGFFEKFLTLWVLICMAIGVLIGRFIPDFSSFMSKLEVANVNIPIAILIWLMIFPMMLKIDFGSIKQVGKQPKGLFLTWGVNWLIKPFMMFLIASLFFMVIYKSVIPTDLAKDYIAGAVLLGAAPCTAMVFVWSSLTKGNPAYTLVQVATNDLLILVLFVPIVGLLLGVSGFFIPWGTLFLSIGLFVVVPLLSASLTRYLIIKKKGIDYLNEKVIPKFSPVTIIGLLLTLIIIFSMQADLIIENPLHILLIAVPLIIQTFLIFTIAYVGAKLLKLPYDIAAPAGMIGASNFFELAVAVAIALFPLNPGVSLATVVGVLVEVPLMLLLVKIANKTQGWFSKNMKEHEKITNDLNTNLPNVAFVCVHNSCRSQMAESIAKEFASDVFKSYSAGTETVPQINEMAVKTVSNLYGIKMDDQYSKLIDDLHKIDIVVTMGCNVECPTLPCKYREDWGLDDPTGKADSDFVFTAETIKAKVEELKFRIINGEITL